MQFRRLSDTMRSSWWGRILAEHDTEPTELLSGLLKTSIGLWLLLPFETLPGSGALRALDIGPEWLWGLIFLSIGVGHLFALQSGERGWRRAASMLGFAIWFVLAVTALWLAPRSLGFSFFGALASAQAWAYLRLGKVRA